MRSGYLSFRVLIGFGLAIGANGCTGEEFSSDVPDGGPSVGSSGSSGGSAGTTSAGSGSGTTSASGGQGGAPVAGTTGTTTGGGGQGGVGAGGQRVDASNDVSPDVGDAASDRRTDARDANTDSGDGSVPPCSFVETLDRRCTMDADCAIGIHQTDCCGNTLAIGFNFSQRERFDTLEPGCRMSYPGCGCPVGPTRTSTGETAFDIAAIKVACVTGGPIKECRTYVTMRPPDTP